LNNRNVPKFFLHANNVHQGGGKSLLMALLAVLPKLNTTIVQLDQRMALNLRGVEGVRLKFIKPSIAQRLLSEWWLARKVRVQDVVVCFGNLPPLFKLAGRAEVFLQNRYLIDNVGLKNFPLKTRLRLWTERIWLSACMANVDAFIVQTPSMQKLLLARTKGKIPVRVLPFVSSPKNYVRQLVNNDIRMMHHGEFVYIASGEPHKNHKTLVRAWCLLAEEKIYPSLKLTVDRSSFLELCDWIDSQIARYKLKITNEGALPHESVIRLYGSASAMIYPSTFESFGLPLIEARQAGLSILASELDYVRDVIDAEETFDPNSAVSIARAVKRFLMKEEPPLSLLDAESFFEQVMDKGV
jgi:glycosyltransferase involved in cell wall biosynthesis